jgi:hypothetical protein
LKSRIRGWWKENFDQQELTTIAVALPALKRRSRRRRRGRGYVHGFLLKNV